MSNAIFPSVLVLGSAFVATNIDGFSVLALLFTLDPPRNRTGAIAWACLGFAVVVAVSACAAFTVQALVPAVARWLGLLLVAVGVVRAFAWFRSRRRAESAAATNATVFAAVLLTGGDNLVIYTGLFANLGAIGVALTGVAYVIAFALLTYVLLLLLARGWLVGVPAAILEPLTALVLIVVGIVLTTKSLPV